MRHLLATLQHRATARMLARTSFCDGCGAVCTPDCRREALQASYRDRAITTGLFRQ